MRIGAIVLAAGSSTRFGGGNKLLADCGGEPVLARTLGALAESCIPADACLVATGADHDLLAAIALRFGMNVLYVSEHARGMGTTLASAVRAVEADIDGVLVMPGDMPAMTAAVIDSVVEAFEAARGDRIAYATLSHGEQRNPVLWPRRLFDQLAALEGPHGGKALIGAELSGVVAVPVTNELALRDIDTRAELDKLVELMRKAGSLNAAHD